MHPLPLTDSQPRLVHTSHLTMRYILLIYLALGVIFKISSSILLCLGCWDTSLCLSVTWGERTSYNFCFCLCQWTCPIPFCCFCLCLKLENRYKNQKYLRKKITIFWDWELKHCVCHRSCGFSNILLTTCQTWPTILEITNMQKTK